MSSLLARYKQNIVFTIASLYIDINFEQIKSFVHFSKSTENTFQNLKQDYKIV